MLKLLTIVLLMEFESREGCYQWSNCVVVLPRSTKSIRFRCSLAHIMVLLSSVCCDIYLHWPQVLKAPVVTS